MKDLPKLERGSLELTSLDEEGLDRYLSWLRSFDTTKYLEVDPSKVTEDYARGWIAAMTRSRNDAVFAIRTHSFGFVGTIRLGPIDWIGLESPIGIMVGESSMRGLGVGSGAIHLVCQWGFEKLGLRRIWAGILPENRASIRAFGKAGFLPTTERPVSTLPHAWATNPAICVYCTSADRLATNVADGSAKISSIPAIDPAGESRPTQS